MIGRLAAILVAVSLGAACFGFASVGASSGTVRCSAANLSVWLDDAPGGAGASHRGYFIDFANLSTHPCVLGGYPGVSAVDLTGHQIGPPAQRESPAGHLVTLAANGGKASALIVFTVTGVYTSGCNARWAAGVRVYAPGDTASKVAPFAIQVCSLRSSMTIGAVTPWKSW